LKRHPGVAEAHYVLSLVYYDAGRFDESLVQAQYARKCAPSEVRILAQVGLCAISANNYGLARDILRQAVMVDPDNVPALNNLGIAHHAMKDFQEALYCLQRALVLNPDYGPARENLRMLFGIESFSSRFDAESNTVQNRVEGYSEPLMHYSPGEEAQQTDALEAEFDADPQNVAAADTLVRHYISTLKLENARDVLNIALAHNPDAVPLINQAGHIAKLLGHLSLAKSTYEKSLTFEPDNVPALLGLGQTLRDLDEHEEALQYFETAASLDANSNTLMMLAFSQVNACRYEEALATCDRIEQLYPQLTPFITSSRAVSHAFIGHFDEALGYIDQARQYETLNSGFVIFRGMLHLMHESYEEGWECYRHRALFQADLLRLLPYPLWQGEDLQGKTILVLAEQGLGDQVMFASCLPDLLALNPKEVVMESNRRVEKTLARSFPWIKVFPSSQKGFDWLPKDLTPDYYAPFADLARHFRRHIEDFPKQTGYLVADPERIAYWKSRLFQAGDRPKIGFTWRGGLPQTRRAIRSLQLDQLLGVLANPGYQFVNLQYGPVQEELAAFADAHRLNIIDWPEAITDLDEFAALISALDLVITVCNTTVHYTGALGKPCWVLTPFIPEWRYGIRSDRMRWYPSTRMFRQPSPGDWGSVLDRVTCALSDLPTAADANLGNSTA
jgi:tetratricopeptide (TPR) repeat protein